MQLFILQHISTTN